MFKLVLYILISPSALSKLSPLNFEINKNDNSDKVSFLSILSLYKLAFATSAVKSNKGV